MTHLKHPPAWWSDRLRWAAGMAFAALLLADPAAALADAQGALALWARAVAPSLFPFLAVLPLLTCGPARDIYARLLGGAAAGLFTLPRRAAAALAVGLIAGSPAGALACRETAAGLERGEFKRLALVACGTGPVYLVSGVGAALLGSRRSGFLLAAAQLAAQLLLGMLLRPLWRGERARMPAQPPCDGGGAMRAAVLSTAQIAGYMTLFSVLSGMLERLLGGAPGLAARLLLDMPSAVATAAGLPLDPAARLPLIAGLAGFGGVCIGAQNLGVLGPLGLRWREYLPAKLAQGLLSAGLCAALLRLPQGWSAAAGEGAALSPLYPACLLMLALLVLALIGFGGGEKRRKEGAGAR